MDRLSKASEADGGPFPALLGPGGTAPRQEIVPAARHAVASPASAPTAASGYLFNTSHLGLFALSSAQMVNAEP